MSYEIASDVESVELPSVAKPSYDFLESLDLDVDVKRRLTIHLASMERGDDTVLLTPLGKDNNPSDILRDLDAMFEKFSDKVNKPLLDLELSNREKFGPRSISLPWSERRTGLSDYFERDRCSIAARKLFPGGLDISTTRLRPLSIEKAIDHLKNSTNAGLPFYKNKGILKERYKEKFESLLDRRDPCVAFTRTQEAKKTRLVWGYPMADTILETRYYRPLLDYQRKLTWRAALIGPSEVDKQITRMLDNCIRSGLSALSIDFKTYDTTLLKRAQTSCFDYIKHLYQSVHHPDIDYIAERFNTIGILTPDGVISGSHGVPSGSTFTNEVDSIYQYLVAKSSATCLDSDMQIQGDDGGYCIHPSKLDKLVNQFNDGGLLVNGDKSKVADNHFIYLQNLYHSDYRDQRTGTIGGIYPIYRAMNRLLYQERWSGFEDFGLKGSDYYSIRAICILENCRNHPLFEEFVKYIKRLDKYSLETTRDGISKYVNYITDSSGTEGILQNQYGDNIKGLKSFKTWRLLR